MLRDNESESTGSTSSSYSSEEEVEPAPLKTPKEYAKGYNLQGSIQTTKERMCPDVPLPCPEIPDDSQFWKEPHVPNVEFIKQHLTKEGKFKPTQILNLFNQAYEIFCAEDNVIEIPAPITICGDVHGQFYDLLQLFDLGGPPHKTTYLFLGDYVDRGDFSIEIVILMLAYKCLYPTTFYMLRGNHECRHLTDHFSFKEETDYKYNLDIYDSAMDVFDALPLAAIVNKQFFCVHGGLSPGLESVADINAINRFVEPPSSGLMCDLLWSDPEENYSSKSPTTFMFNVNRGTSYSYGYKAVVEFLNKNQWLSVIRAHESQESGYRMYEKNAKTGFPSLITLFSAPNYCTQYNNTAAIMRYENNSMTIKQFTDSPHPYYLPSFMNVFEWSLPFVAEKLAELLLGLLRIVDNDEEEEQIEAAQEARAVDIRRKVIAVSRMLAMYKVMRNQREQDLTLSGLKANSKGHLPTDKFSSELKQLSMASQGDATINKFELAKSVDSTNEARPKDGLDQALRGSPHQSDESLKRMGTKERILAMKRASPPPPPIAEATASGFQVPRIFEADGPVRRRASG